jgi:hypothetical protein
MRLAAEWVTPAVGTVCPVQAEAASAFTGANSVRGKHDIHGQPLSRFPPLSLALTRRGPLTKLDSP